MLLQSSACGWAEMSAMTDSGNYLDLLFVPCSIPPSIVLPKCLTMFFRSIHVLLPMYLLQLLNVRRTVLLSMAFNLLTENVRCRLMLRVENECIILGLQFPFTSLAVISTRKSSPPGKMTDGITDCLKALLKRRPTRKLYYRKFTAWPQTTAHTRTVLQNKLTRLRK